MKRLIAFLLCAALCYFQQDSRAGWLPLAKPASGGGSAPVFAWQNTQNTTFVQSTGTNVGSTDALGSNGAFTAGTVLVAKVIVQAASLTFTFTGWTQIDVLNDATNTLTIGLFYHVCDGTEGPGSFPISWVTNAFYAWTLQAFTGASATPIDVHTTNTWSSAGGTSIVTSSITPTVANDLFLLHVYNLNTTTLTAPADMTQRFNVLMNSGGFLVMASDRTSSGLTAQTETFTAGSIFKSGGYFLTAIHP